MDKNIVVKSPVTPDGDAVLIETLPVQRIVEGYRKLLGIDVSKYFGGNIEIAIYRCTDTGFRFYYPESIFADEEFYAFLQKRDSYYSEWHWEHEAALKKLLPQSKVLEVGCGTGSFMINLKEKGFNCTGLELNAAAVKVCRQKGLKVYNELLEIHVIQNSGEYDAVCAFQVLEHIYDVRSFINECLKCLKPGGKLIFAVPNSNPYLFKYDKYHTMNLPPHHSGLWNKAAFQKLPAFYPLKVDTIKFEPLFNRQYFLNGFFVHFKLGLINKIMNKIPPRIINNLLWPLKFFVKGRNILAVFIKGR
jgi:SAM-dependent methyltransferase